MLEPRKVKFRKMHKAVPSASREDKNAVVGVGSYGIISMEDGRISSRQIEACRRVILKRLKRRGKLWIGIFPDKSVTKKPAEVRMGKGKGSVDHWVALVREGRVLFEIHSEVLTEEAVKNIFKLAGCRLPVKTKLVRKLW